MTAAQLKALFQTNIGSRTAPGSIYPLSVTDCLDAIVDSIVAGDIGGGGGTAPTITSKSVANATPSVIDVVFSQSMTAVTIAGFSAKKNGVAWVVSSVTGAGTNWSFTMATSAVNGDTLLMSYDSTTGATIGTTLELVTFTDSSVTNNVSGSSIAWTDVTAWAATDGVSVTGGNSLLQSTSNGSARNALKIAAGGNGRTRMTYHPCVIPASQGYILGFGLGTAIAYFATDYDHCLVAVNGTVQMYKSGAAVGTSHSVSDGDDMMIEVNSGNVNLYKSTDGGSSWTLLDTTTEISGASSAAMYLKASIGGASGPNTMSNIKQNGLS